MIWMQHDILTIHISMSCRSTKIVCKKGKVQSGWKVKWWGGVECGWVGWGGGGGRGEMGERMDGGKEQGETVSFNPIVLGQHSYVSLSLLK